MTKITTADFQKGMFIDFRGEPHQIVEFQFVNPGKGSAFVRAKLKAIKSDKVLEFTYKSGESAEQIPVNVRELQYLYKKENSFIFMDQSDYEQITVNRLILGNFSNYLKEGENYQIYIYNGEAIGIRIPKKVKLQVIEAGEGVKGNTVSGARKTVLLETGVRITVPLFIKNGDLVSVDPETNEYVERVSQA